VAKLPAGLSQTLKHAQVPVVAAVQGMALGGGCEFVMHASRTVCGARSYVGLVEAGVGLIPAGGGCKEFALRASMLLARGGRRRRLPLHPAGVPDHRHGHVSKSALEACELGFAARIDDGGVQRPRNPPRGAADGARAGRIRLAAAAGPPRGVKVAGRNGIATCEMMLVNMKEGGIHLAHDYRVAKAAATALCGGEVETNRTLVNEQWMLAVERAQFVELLKTEKTQQRIAHMLETGKPLRN
jgi:3-hydroxyacyl-CoA dehydrogenase